MALFGNNSKEKEVYQPSTPTPVMETPNPYVSSPNSMNVIGKGTTITGDIDTSNDIRIDGKLEGNLFCKAKVILGSSAVLEGNLSAVHAEISGEVVGKVEVTEMLTLKNSCTIHGDINTGKLIIEAGAKFNGSCKMGAVSKEVSLNGSNNLKKPVAASV
ncbi:MAG TPA: polymer-forming cytoskeletal protein [Catalimonadaceae bacterium]|nr:polymer-forming cytoskeletal protein [Catalimonadaceae bacterium]